MAWVYGSVMAKITDITAVALEHSLGADHAYGMARGLTPVRQATLLQVETDTGITGIGEAWGQPAGLLAGLELVRPYFLGREIFDREQVPPFIYAQRYHLGIQNGITGCLSGINIALYDALGKLFGVPVYKLLGGRLDDRLPAYASNGYFAVDPHAQLESQLRGFRHKGFPGVKIKIGHGPRDDENRVALARDVLGPDVLLMVDANGNYTVDMALESMRRIAPYDIHFFEEPLPPTDFEGYRDLRARASMPIATGEALYTAHDFKRLMDARGADVLQPDLTLCGGFDVGRQILAMAQVNHVRVSVHVWGGAVGLAAAIHFMAAMPAWPHTDAVPYPALLEYDRGQNALRDELLTEPIPCIDGHLLVPEGPGLGVSLDWQAVERYRIGAAAPSPETAVNGTS